MTLLWDNSRSGSPSSSGCGRPLVSFSGRWQDRPQLADSVSGAVYGIFAALAVASLALWKGLAGHDFNIEYVAAYTSTEPAVGLHLLGVLGGAEGVAALLGGGAVTLRRAGPAADAAALPVPAPLRRWGHLGGHRLLRLYHAVRRQSVRADGVHPGGRPGAQSPAAEPGDDDPSPDALPGLHQPHHPVRLRHRRAPVPQPRHRLDPRDPQVDPGQLALPLDRHHARDVVGLRRAGLGRLLGLGSGGEREPAPLAHHDRVPPFGHDPGEARDAEAVEPGTDHRDLPAQHLRHIHHPLRA